ncbi:MAG: hypothetical protein WCI47_01585 [bacterium]
MDTFTVKGFIRTLREPISEDLKNYLNFCVQIDSQAFPDQNISSSIRLCVEGLRSAGYSDEQISDIGDNAKEIMTAILAEIGFQPQSTIKHGTEAA